jgi:hypothetical protein
MSVKQNPAKRIIQYREYFKNYIFKNDSFKVDRTIYIVLEDVDRSGQE